MARSKLSSRKRQNLVLGLCRALCVLKSPEEVADALADLLSPTEIETIAKRLQIAEYLVKNWEYDAIRLEIGVGYSTIARVNTWLSLSGNGFRMMLDRRKKSPQLVPDEQKYDPFSWYNFKRRYSAYFWPQLLIEGLLKNADKKEKERIKSMLNELDIKKSRFTSQTNKALYEMFANHPTPASSPKK